MKTKDVFDATSNETGALAQYLRLIKAMPQLSRGEERVLGRRIREGSREARNALVEANLLFVVSFVRRYRGCGALFLDLIGAGNVGLVNAADHFDPQEAGCALFRSYALPWIKEEVFKLVGDTCYVVRLPPKRVDVLRRMSAASAKLSLELQRKPTRDEVAEEASVPTQLADELARVGRAPLSLDTMEDEEGETYPHERIPQAMFDLPEASAVKVIVLQVVRDAVCGELTPRERDVVERHHGLAHQGEETPKEISDGAGYSRNRIWQIYGQALEKMRLSPRIASLCGFV